MMGEIMKKYISFLMIFALTIIIERPLLSVKQSQNLSNKVIVVDPGHGGYDNGASFKGYDEDDLNLQISFALKEYLETQGAIVYLTRTDDQDMTRRNYLYSKDDDMYLRRQTIDYYQPDLFVSIHLNSAHSSAYGSQVFYYNNSNNGRILASCIHDALKKVTNTPLNISESDFYILKNTSSLGVLVECGFLSNANERGQLVSRQYQKKIAQSICEGIKTYICEKNPI